MKKIVLCFLLHLISFAMFAQNSPAITYEKINCNPGSPNEGSIVLSISGGQSPYTVLWGDGDTELFKYNLSPGSYSVTVTDLSGEKDDETINVGNDVIWYEIYDAVVDGDSLSKANSTLAWDSEIISLNETPPHTNGELTFTISTLDGYTMVGLSRGHTIVSYKDISFAFYNRIGVLQIYESGYKRGSFGNLSIGDVLKIKLENNRVKYYKNGALIRNSYGYHNVPIFANCAMYGFPPPSPSTSKWKLDASTTFGYQELQYDDAYATLTKKPNETTPHLVASDHKLRFKIDERYEIVGTGPLDYAIYNWQRKDYSNSTLTRVKGNNYYELDLSTGGFTQDEYYTLEVNFNQNEKAYLRFKYAP